MANKLFEQLEGNNPQTNQFNTFMQNPFQFLMQRRGINVPQDFQNDPHSAVNYLIQSGRMNQGAFNKVYQTLQRMGFKF